MRVHAASDAYPFTVIVELIFELLVFLFVPLAELLHLVPFGGQTFVLVRLLLEFDLRAENVVSHLGDVTFVMSQLILQLLRSLVILPLESDSCYSNRASACLWYLLTQKLIALFLRLL